MTYNLVTITDWGDQYLDGALMQFHVMEGENGITLAYCVSLEVARALANALAETVVIIPHRSIPTL